MKRGHRNVSGMGEDLWRLEIYKQNLGENVSGLSIKHSLGEALVAKLVITGILSSPFLILAL